MTFIEWCEQTGRASLREDMRAKATWDAATLAERERCAKLCDEIEAKAMADDKFSRSDIAFGKAAAAEACAEAIRAN